MELTESSEGDVEFAIYSALEATISANVDAEIAAKPDAPLPFPKEVLVNRILQKNIDQLEESLYLTRGYDGTVYLAGGWLMRPVMLDGKSVSTMEYIRQMVDTSNVVFAPDKTGAEIRREVWNEGNGVGGTA